jgi:phage shock protein E
MIGFLKKLFKSEEPIAYKELLHQGAVIVDVRTPEEYQAGHIKTSINIPLNQLGNYIHEFKKKGKPVITCCRSGMRSGNAKNLLSSAGIEAYNGGPWNLLEQKIK